MIRLRTVCLLLAGTLVLGAGLFALLVSVGPLGLALTPVPEVSFEPSVNPVPRSIPTPTPTPRPTPTAVAAPMPRPDPTIPRHTPVAPKPTPTPKPSPGARPPDPALIARLHALLAGPDATAAQELAVVVLDARGRPVMEQKAGAPMLPASTEKVVTAAGALARFGPEHRYVTVMRATARPGSNGVLRGDLVVSGSGDPALATPLFAQRVLPDRPRTPLEWLAEQIAAAGIKRIEGRVLGDPTAFANQPVPAGWPSHYLQSVIGTNSSGLTVNAGRDVFTRDGALLASAANDPALETAELLVGLLDQRGVAVSGGAGSTRKPPETVVELGRVFSPPLRELLDWMLAHSDNHMADQIFRTIGAADRAPTWQGSAQAIRRVLAPLRLDWSGAVLADGSGLSRDNRLSAGLLTRLQFEAAVALGDDWLDLLAVAGESGTLRSRLVDTGADGRLFAKTGYLSDVRALTGTVVGPGDQRFHVTVLGNDLDAVGQQGVRRLTHNVVLTLTGVLFDCYAPLERPPPTGSENASPRPKPKPKLPACVPA